jgi:hypothetical protein
MVPSARKAIACILLICGVAVYSHSQTGPTKETTAGISGRVTSKDKGVQGVNVIASLTRSNGPVRGGTYRGTTDLDGKYRITNVPAGTYRLDVFAPTLVLENVETDRAVVIADGETVENVNFAMLRGGVITGKITNPDGQPVIAEFVSITPVSPHDVHVRYYPGTITTDDRGIYRAFGLRPAKYKVSVGIHEHLLTSKYRRTFYPSVIDETKATLIEVREGSEISNVDIVAMRNNAPGYKVSGRIVDGESGKPLANVPYGLMRTTDEGTQSMHTNVVTNAAGQFTFHNVPSGHYSVFIVREKTEVRAKPTPFEVVDGDVSGIVVKTMRGASLSGVVVFEGKGFERTAGDLVIHVWIDTATEYFEDTDPVPINANGGFRLAGLAGGAAVLAVSPASPETPPVGIVRVEHDGIVLPRSFPVQDGEQVGGLRVVVKRFTGAISGQIKFENGEMPPDSQLSVFVMPAEDEPDAPRNAYGAHVDGRGRFSLDGLNAGTYEIHVSVVRDRRAIAPVTKQSVVVADHAVSEVTVTVKLGQDRQD